MQSGKIDMLKSLLPDMKARGDRVLLFSFFTMMLDILEVVLDTLGITYMRLDGSTKVDERQDMIDQFHREEDITVFLLSTKAGSFSLPFVLTLCQVGLGLILLVRMLSLFSMEVLIPMTINRPRTGPIGWDKPEM